MSYKSDHFIYHLFLQDLMPLYDHRYGVESGKKWRLWVRGTTYWISHAALQRQFRILIPFGITVLSNGKNSGWIEQSPLSLQLGFFMFCWCVHQLLRRCCQHNWYANSNAVVQNKMHYVRLPFVTNHYSWKTCIHNKYTKTNMWSTKLKNIRSERKNLTRRFSWFCKGIWSIHVDNSLVLSHR